MALKLKFWPKVLVTGSVEVEAVDAVLVVEVQARRAPRGCRCRSRRSRPRPGPAAPWKSRVASGSEFRNSMSKLSPTVLLRVLISGAFWMTRDLLLLAGVDLHHDAPPRSRSGRRAPPSWTTVRSLGAEALTLNMPGNRPWKRNAPSSLVVVLFAPPICVGEEMVTVTPRSGHAATGRTRSPDRLPTFWARAGRTPVPVASPERSSAERRARR